MAKFCNKCGKPLINGQPCNCQKKKNIIKVMSVVSTLTIAAAITIYAFNGNNRSDDESNSVYSSETETITATTTVTTAATEENTESAKKETNYIWYLKPSVEADELYTYDFEAVDYADYIGGKNDVYDWFAVVKKDGFYNIVDYNGKQYLTEKYTDYFEHACVGIMLDKAEGDEVTDDYTRDYNAGSEYNEWSDNNLTIWYNSDIKKIEFVKGGSSTQGHGGKPGVIYTLENNEIVYHDYGLEFDDYPNDLSNETDSSVLLNEFNKSHALVIIDTNSNKFGIAYNNQEIVPCSYKKVYENGNFTWLGNDDNWELYDSKGKKVLDFVCNSVNINTEMVSSDFNKFVCSDGSGLMDYSEESIPFLPTENIIAVYTSDGCAYFGTDGSQITDYGEFEEIRPVHNNLAWVKKDGKWGVIQFNGRNTYVTPEIAESEIAEKVTSPANTNVSEKLNVHKFIYDDLVPEYGLSELTAFENIDWTNLKVHDYPDSVQGVISVPYLDDKSFIIARLEAHSMCLDYYVANENTFKFVNSIELYNFNEIMGISNFKLYTCGEDKIAYSYQYTSPPAGSKYGTYFGVIEINSSGISENLVISGLRNPGVTMITVDDKQWSCEEVDELNYTEIKDEIIKKLNNLNVSYKNIELGWIGDAMYGVDIDNNWLNVISLDYDDSYGNLFSDFSVLKNKFFIEQAGLDYDKLISENENKTVNNNNNNGGNDNNSSNDNNNNNNNNDNASEYATGYVRTDDGDELFVRSSPEIIDSPGKGNKFDCFPNGTALNIDLSKSVDNWYYVTGIGLSGNPATGYVSKQFVVIN